jgi:hypothetical protein
VSVIRFGFPTLLILWKSIGDDGGVNQLETAIMISAVRADAVFPRDARMTRSLARASGAAVTPRNHPPG